MILIDHAAYDERTITTNLGAPEYSYWFVRKAFRPIFQRFGTLHSVADPDIEVDAIYRAAHDRGEPCLFFSFNPPQYIPLELECPTIPVFAWEYDTIPTEVWGTNPQDDWRMPLSRCGAAITHCQSSVRAVRRAMGDGFPIWSIPAPMFSTNQPQGTAKGWQTPMQISVEGGIAIDTAAVDVSIFHSDTLDTLGVRTLRAMRRKLAEPGHPPQTLDLSGVVYTSVFNPADGRKNWKDLVSGFVWAFRDNPDATLIVKVTQADVLEGLMLVLARLAKLGRYRCRVIVIQGMLSDTAYAGLIEATSYVVNTSHGEGQCLPLMEFMSSGRPAIAPQHSAMAEYITPDNAFTLRSFSRLVEWPHDTREARRCHHREIDFASLVDAYRESFRVARDDPKLYRHMSEAASIALEYYCSDEIVLRRAGDLLHHLTGQRPAVAAPAHTTNGKKAATVKVLRRAADALGHLIGGRRSGAAQTATTSAAEGDKAAARDAWMAGWFQPGGELYHGFHIGTGDGVVVLGQGGEITDFCTAARARSVREATLGDPLTEGAATRVISLDTLDRAEDPAAALAALVRAGAPGARYLITVPSAERIALQQAANPSDKMPDAIAPGTLKTLVEAAGLTVVHEDRDGFFRTLRDAFATQRTEEDPADGWQRVWSQMLAASPDGGIQRMFDRTLPGRHIIVAVKPGPDPLPLPSPRPGRPWQAEWRVPGDEGIEQTDPFMQGLRDSVFAGWYNAETRELVPGFPVSEDDVLLDHGCGGGGSAAFCADQGAKLYLADIDPAIVEDTRMSILARAQRPIETVATDGDPLPLPDAMFSRVICTEVLEHVDDPARIVAELVRVGQPGALYLLTAPAAAVEHIQEVVGPEDHFRQPNHVRIFEEGEVAALAQRAGLTVERQSGDGFFWSVGLFLLWTKGVRPAGRNPTLDLWGATWKAVLDGPRGAEIKATLDRLLPKRQVVVARKGLHE